MRDGVMVARLILDHPSVSAVLPQAEHRAEYAELSIQDFDPILALCLHR